MEYRKVENACKVRMVLVKNAQKFSGSEKSTMDRSDLDLGTLGKQNH
jgi:hypothetical protein